MKAYLIDVNEGRHEVVEISEHDQLGQFYKLIGCECIDIAVRRIGGKPFNIIVDDEGLLVSHPIISAVDGRMRGMLAGNLVIMGMDSDWGELTGITDEDAELIAHNLVLAIDYDREVVYPAVVMEY